MGVGERERERERESGVASEYHVYVDRCAAENSVPIVHCVQGSKTGIFEPYPDTNFGDMISTRDAFIVVDACQVSPKLNENNINPKLNEIINA